MKKKLTMVAALVLVFALGVTGTLAYLTAKTDTITNTFTVGNVKIALEETDADKDQNLLANSYKMIPGNEITKDPKVTVEKDSEACWLFVKVEKIGEATLEDGTKKVFDDFITYTIGATGVDGVAWAKLQDGVYYIKQDATTADVTYSVLAGDKVTVKDGVTQEMMDALAKGTLPQLKITAYAIQQANIGTAGADDAANAAAAWTEVSAS